MMEKVRLSFLRSLAFWKELGKQNIDLNLPGNSSYREIDIWLNKEFVANYGILKKSSIN